MAVHRVKHFGVLAGEIDERSKVVVLKASPAPAGGSSDQVRRACLNWAEAWCKLQGYSLDDKAVVNGKQ